MLNSACRELTFYCFPPKNFEEGTSVSSYDKGCVDPAQIIDKEGIPHIQGLLATVHVEKKFKLLLLAI